ncbi:SGNH/GDSL hydrolase family protein [Nocardioides albidus]|nr:SGNH/GDSL hydrolase family protein [Nocardioides albidus]
MPTIRGAAALALALCIAASTACEDRAPEADGPPPRLQAGDEYVALGDSYTAAFLTGETDPESRGCFRSLTNYPRRVAERLSLELTDVSCGGASTENITRPQQVAEGEDVPPQIEAVGEDTDLVTIGLGGNDFNLFGALVVNCVVAAQQDPTGAPCTDLSESDPSGKSNVAKIRSRLTKVVGAVRKRAPDARVVLIGYPQVFPQSGRCAQLPLAEGDVPLAHDFLRALDVAVSGAARKSGAEFVDVWSASAGHDICSADPWIAGASPVRSDATAYHPYPEEQELVASLLLDVLESEGDRA